MTNIVNLAPFNDFLPRCPFCGERPLEYACDHLKSFIELETPEEGGSRIVYLSPDFQRHLRDVVGAEFQFSLDISGPPDRNLNNEYYFVNSGLLEDSNHLSELSSAVDGAITFQQRMTSNLTRSITFAISSTQYHDLRIKNDQIQSFQYIAESRTLHEYRKLCAPSDQGYYFVDLEESEILEFKQTFSRDVRTGQVSKDLRRAVIKEICGFLNTHSGDLLIGVKDSSREIVGIENDDFKDKDEYSLKIMNLIKDLCGTTAATLVEINFLEVNNLTLCIVKCKKSNQPVYCKFNGTDPIPFVRYGSSTIQPGYEDWGKFQNQYFGKKFSN